MSPDLTVITVCKNAISSLEATIKSVLAQENAQIEYIVIDGGSTDGSLGILQTYRQNIACVVSEADRGIYDAMNKGLALAHGKLIYFLNSNDRFFDKNVAERAIAAYRALTPDILFGDVIVTDDEPVQISYRNWDIASFFEGPICHQAVFATPRAFQQCGEFNIAYKYAADFDWILCAFRRNRLRVRYLPGVVCYFDGKGLTGEPNGMVNQPVRAEMSKILNLQFNRLERLIYKLARRVRLRQYQAILSILTRVMRWKLRG